MNRLVGAGKVGLVTTVPRAGEKKFEILAYIVDYCADHQYGPMLEEIREKMSLATRSSVQWHIDDLREDGYVSNIARKKRTLRPTERGVKLVSLMRESA